MNSSRRDFLKWSTLSPTLLLLGSISQAENDLGLEIFGPRSLNPNHTFASFRVNRSNEFAQAASKHVAQNAFSKKFNPLVLLGGRGSGKSHLMAAVGHEIRRQDPFKKILVLSGFAFREENLPLGAAEVLLVDDVHVLDQKKQMQLKNWIDRMVAQNRQVILTSQHWPKSERFHPKFEKLLELGLLANILPMS